MSTITASPAVEVAGLSKRFVLHGHGMNPLKRMAKRLLPGYTRSEHWALRDVTFQLRSGDSLALLGVNGSGKSTLLKLITGVMSPTSGTVRVSGRVGGLIELAAGFHGDLTGYENIFLNGTLLGLTRREIWSKLNAIEEFCELGSFLNSPVRHYSWGMFLRLGFAIAVHADPDIFIVDEALAVGDGYFQWKCMRKIEEFRAEGRTIIFVSHLPEVAESVCRRAIWLHQGQLRAQGDSSDVVQEYNGYLFQDVLHRDPTSGVPALATLMPYNRFGSGEVLIQNVRFVGADGIPRRYFRSGEQMEIVFDAFAKIPVEAAAVYSVISRAHQPVSFFDSADRGTTVKLQHGPNRISFRYPALPLHEATYYASLAIGVPGNHELLYDCHQKIYAFQVLAPEHLTVEDFSARVIDLSPEISLKAEQTA